MTTSIKNFLLDNKMFYSVLRRDLGPVFIKLAETKFCLKSQVLVSNLRLVLVSDLLLFTKWLRANLVSDLVSNLRLVHSCLKYFGKSLKHYFTLTEIHVFTFYGLM